MSMSSHVIFLRDKTDLQYQRFLKVFLACREAGTGLPEEVDNYFGGYGVGNDPEAPLQISFNPRAWTDVICPKVLRLMLMKYHRA